MGKNDQRKGDVKSETGRCCLAVALRLRSVALLSWEKEGQC